MPRPPRLFLHGVPLHVHHRGNNRGDIFRDDYDRLVFLRWLLDASRKHEVAIHNWVLMTNHFHYLGTPTTSTSLPRAMQDVGSRYVRYFNRRHGRTGTLWEGRYSAHLVDSEAYWFRCARYIELNPVRASIVSAPHEHRWSSFQTLGCGAADTITTPHPLYLALGATEAARQAAYRALCGSSLTDAELGSIRDALRRGRIVTELARREPPTQTVLTGART